MKLQVKSARRITGKAWCANGRGCLVCILDDLTEIGEREKMRPKDLEAIKHLALAAYEMKKRRPAAGA